MLQFVQRVLTVLWKLFLHLHVFSQTDLMEVTSVSVFIEIDT